MSALGSGSTRRRWTNDAEFQEFEGVRGGFRAVEGHLPVPQGPEDESEGQGAAPGLGFLDMR